MSTLDAPDAAAVAHAVSLEHRRPPPRHLCSIFGSLAQVQLLQDIGAMDKEQQLAPLGYHLAKLPVPPKVPAGVFILIIVIVIVIINVTYYYFYY
jgi:hypothetical protein